MAERKGTDGALSIGFLHPDLGIGGAERLVVDAAHGLAKQKGHRVTMYTSHFNPERCFAECNSGSFPTRVHGDFLPRHIAGRLHNMFALLRNIWLAIRVGLSPRERHDVLVCDQISVCVPILRLLWDQGERTHTHTHTHTHPGNPTELPVAKIATSVSYIRHV